MQKNVCLSAKSKQSNFKTKEISAIFSPDLCIFYIKKKHMKILRSQEAGSQPMLTLEMKNRAHF